MCVCGGGGGGGGVKVRVLQVLSFDDFLEDNTRPSLLVKMHSTLTFA